MHQDDDPFLTPGVSGGESISQVKELDVDGAPARVEGLGRARELALGLLLLAGVLAWAGWSWWHAAVQENSYAAGSAAAAAHDWDMARQQFQAASGYKDADAQAARVAGIIAERDNHYAKALIAAGAHDWLSALAEAGQVEVLQDNYRNIKSVSSEASDGAYGDSVAGSVALRPMAQPPGLYYRTPMGWLWLEGSDDHSALRSSSTLHGGFVYDVPLTASVAGNAGAVQPSGTAVVSGTADWEDSAYRAQRRLVLATPRDTGNNSAASAAATATDRGVSNAAGALAFAALPLDMAVSQAVDVGKSGLWVSGSSGGSADYGNAPLFPQLGNISSLAFLPMGASHASQVWLPSPRSGRAVVGLDVTSDRLLVAEWTSGLTESGTVSGTPQAGSGSGAQPEIVPALRLYVEAATAAGSGPDPARRLLYTLKGRLDGAQFSEDGRWVLLTTFVPEQRPVTDLYVGSNQIVLLDTSGVLPPRVLASHSGVQVRLGTFYGGFVREPMQAGFVREGPYAGQIVISNYTGPQSEQTTLSLANPGSASPLATAVAQVALPGQKYWTGTSDERGLVLLGQGDIVQGSTVPTQTLTVVRLTPGTAAAVAGVSMTAGSYEGFPHVRADNLVLDSFTSPSNSGSVGSEQLSSVALSALNARTQAIQSTPALSLTVSVYNSSAATGAEGPTFVLGPGLLGYSQGQALHMRSYDGAQDVALEKNIAALYSTDPYAGYIVLR